MGATAPSPRKRANIVRGLLKLLRWPLIIIGTLAIVVASGVIAAELSTRWAATRARTLPAPTGPYAVGRRSLAWRDEFRQDPLAPDPMAMRELFVWVWYPAANVPGAAPAPYLPKPWLNVIGRQPSQQHLDRVRPHAIDGAPVSAAQPTYPVLVFSPGLSIQPISYTALAEDLASHGYIVVAIAHPYSTPVVAFPDGHVVRAHESPVSPPLPRLVRVLAGDMVWTLDHVIKEHDRGDALFSRIDTTRVGAFGHSFGGASSALACRMDQRFKAGMDFDGSLFGDVIFTGIRQPFMLVMADLDWTRTLRSRLARRAVNRGRAHVNEAMFFDRTPTAYWLTVAGLTHMNFADQSYFFDPKERLMELLGVRLDGEETHELASTYIRAFFGRYLSGVESPGHELERPPHPYLQLDFHRAP